MQVLQKALNALGALLLYVRIAVHRVQLFMSQTVEYRTAPVHRRVRRAVLLLGDGTAEGIGDSLGSTGLCSRVARLLRNERQQSGLHLVWGVLTLGRMFSTARDWSATAPHGATLLHRAVRTRAFADASVVVLLFGMHDDVRDERLPADVAAIARAVALLGKHVVVAALPNFYHHKDARYAGVRAANQRLKLAVQQVAQELKPSGVSVTCDVDTMKTTALGAHTATEHNGFFTLNANGYRLFAREVYEEVVLAAKRVEWAHWKDRINM